MGIAEFDQTGPLGVLGGARNETYRTKLIGSALGWAHDVCPLKFSA
jgi:hypothetical protein